jgi:hypothetical protein
MNSHSLADRTPTEIIEDQPPFAGLSRCGRRESQSHPRRCCTWAGIHSVSNGSISSSTLQNTSITVFFCSNDTVAAECGTFKLGSPPAEPIRTSEPHRNPPNAGGWPDPSPTIPITTLQQKCRSRHSHGMRPPSKAACMQDIDTWVRRFTAYETSFIPIHVTLCLERNEPLGVPCPRFISTTYTRLGLSNTSSSM